MRWRTAAVWLLGAAAWAGPGAAAVRALDRPVFSLVNDNDMFARTDRRYTNGVRLAWSWMPARAGGRRRISVSLQQLMNTPEDVTRPDSPAGQQPYAGYLGLGLAVHGLGPGTLDTLGFDLGLIGPASLAGATQKAFHRWLGFKPVRGWGSQLGNEPVFGVWYDHRRKIGAGASGPGLKADAGYRAGASLGTALTSAWAGGEVRAGWNLPAGFAPVAPPFGAGSGGPDGSAGGARWSAYGYFAASAQAVLRDAFLDGGLRGGGTGLDRYPGRMRLEAGLAARWKSLGLSFAYVAHSRRYAGEPGPHVYGQLGLSLAF